MPHAIPFPRAGRMPVRRNSAIASLTSTPLQPFSSNNNRSKLLETCISMLGLGLGSTGAIVHVARTDVTSQDIGSRCPDNQTLRSATPYRERCDLHTHSQSFRSARWTRPCSQVPREQSRQRNNQPCSAAIRAQLIELIAARLRSSRNCASVNNAFTRYLGNSSKVPFNCDRVGIRRCDRGHLEPAVLPSAIVRIKIEDVEIASRLRQASSAAEPIIA